MPDAPPDGPDCPREADGGTPREGGGPPDYAGLLGVLLARVAQSRGLVELWVCTPSQGPAAVMTDDTRKRIERAVTATERLYWQRLEQHSRDVLETVGQTRRLGLPVVLPFPAG